MKPQFSQLSPITGFRRLASLRNLMEFSRGDQGCSTFIDFHCHRSRLAVANLSGAGVCAWLPGPVAFSALVAFAVTGALSFVILGLADIPVQRWLFGRDMKMTRSEYKREHRDIEGDPYIRREFNRLRQEAVSVPYQSAKAGPTLVFAGNRRAIAIRFVRDETPMPMIAGKASGEDALQLENAARRMQIPVIRISAWSIRCMIVRPRAVRAQRFLSFGCAPSCCAQSGLAGNNRFDGAVSMPRIPGGPQWPVPPEPGNSW